MMLRRAATLSLFALLLPTCVAAQNEYERFVMDLAEEFGELFAEEGYHDTGNGAVSSLAEDATEVHYFMLPAGGDFVIFGVCDADCDDLDLILYDPAGNEVDRDWEPDDSPIVGVDGSVGGQYRVEVGMPGCSAEPCYYAVSVYRGDGISATGGGEAYVEQVLEILAAASSLMADQGYSAADEPTVSSLNSGDSEDQYLTLLAGRDYVLVAVCDEDCSDIDLTIYDPAGSEIAADTETDDTPVLEGPSAAGGRYRVQVRMYTCSNEPCYYALGTYARGAKALLKKKIGPGEAADPRER